MSSQRNPRLRIIGLARAEALAIQDAAGKPAIQIEERRGASDEHRDLGTTVILLASIAPAVIRIVADHIDRRARTRKEPSKIVIEKTVDGETQRYTLELPGFDPGRGSVPAVLNELAKILEVSVKSLEKV